MIAAAWFFAGVPAGWQIAFTLALVVVVAMLAWAIVLLAHAVRSEHQQQAERQHRTVDPNDFWWVFMVPALDEEVTIADSVDRLGAIPLAHRRIVVIDDGSTDATPRILASMRTADLQVIRRDPPFARLGKAAALNHAYQQLDLPDVDRDRVIVVVVDADGRLDPAAPAAAAQHFCDPQVGGVQSLVRIYNRNRVLTWFQDLEFGVYGHLYQAGRNSWGTAGLGGNGQFTRLSALDIVADTTGPWRDRLTEDQDLGLRLIAQGWKGRQSLDAVVEQQGLSSLRRLLRQRTRWSQGNLQAMRLIGTIWRAPAPRAARLEMLTTLMMPILQGIVGIALIGALGLVITGTTTFWGSGPTWHLVLFYLLAFGGTTLGCVAARRRQGRFALLRGLALGHLYAFYTWMIWPVLLRSAARQITGQDRWAKTAREALAGVPGIAAEPEEIARPDAARARLSR